MYPRRTVRQAFRLGLLVTLVVLALSACGGGEEEARGPPPTRGPESPTPR